MLGFFRKVALVFIFSCLVSNTAFSQSTKFAPDGISGSIGAGFATFKINSPSNLNFKMDQGTYAAAIGEKGFGVLNLYLTISLSYLQTTGLTNYNYTTLAGQNFNGTDVKFNTSLFQAGLGLRFKIIDGYWIRPYVEGGGVGGYYQIKYSNLPEKVGTNPNIKKEDNLLDFGTYAEAGAEIAFAATFGIRAAARLIKSETKEFDTLSNQKIGYESTIYYFGLLKAF